MSASQYFHHAIVRMPCREIVNGLTSADLGVPDYEKALDQHADYVEALRKCGLVVTILDEDPNFPDSTFVEDTALLTPFGAIMTRPGALSRRDEVGGMEETLKRRFDVIEHVESPGTVEAGDIMHVDSHYFIGLSERTNAAGAAQVIGILEAHGLSGSTIALKRVLHLKTGVSYLESGFLVTAGEFIDHPRFQKFERICIDDDESYAANCLWVNDVVLVPRGYPKAKQRIESHGFETLDVDLSEFRKLDGGLSCLSLRF